MAQSAGFFWWGNVFGQPNFGPPIPPPSPRNSIATAPGTPSQVPPARPLPPARAARGSAYDTARALDAADGVIDGKYFGRDIRVVKELR